MNSLKDVVEKHFSRVINQIEAGLPEVQEDDVADSMMENLEGIQWTCPTCTNLNANNTLQCGICRTKKPDILGALQ